MKKIPSLFIRDYENPFEGCDTLPTLPMLPFKLKKGRFLATREITPGCEWVINGEGVATRKWDGTAVRIKEGLLYKRYDAKNGKVPPPEFEPCQEPDIITGHWPGWIPINISPDKWIIEAHYNTFTSQYIRPLDGTYEAVGPKINGNKDRLSDHELKKHGSYVFYESNTHNRDYDTLKRFFSEANGGVEGIVFHHPDGRMCKVKRTDFGLVW